MGLWSDIRALSKAEFEAEVDKCRIELDAAAGRIAPRRLTRKRAGPADDKPATRISFLLKEKLGLSEDEAIRKLSASLRQQGVGPEKIPQGGGDLRAWLDELLDRVSGSVVMGAAHKIENR